MPYKHFLIALSIISSVPGMVFAVVTSSVSVNIPASDSVQAVATSIAYTWTGGGWSTCSLACGSGNQSRKVTCIRSDGITVPDSFCTGTKLPLTQTCNTQACAVTLAACGSSNGSAFNGTPATNLCTLGVASSVTVGSVYTWTCSGGNLKSITCSASRINSSANGVSSVTGVQPEDGVWTFIAKEGSTVKLDTTKTVRYGINKKWITKNLSGSVPCSNTFFGSDPAVGIVKQCEVLSSVSTNPTVPATPKIPVATTSLPSPVSIAVSCGESANKMFSVMPSVNLCTTGTATPVIKKGSVYTWSCSLASSSTNCAAVLLPQLSVKQNKDTTTTNYIGLGTSFLNDWDGSYAFVDIMKHARAWQDAADWHNPVRGLDANGWPTADASTVIYAGPSSGINGTHKLVFTGQADISLMWSAGRVTNKKYDVTTNKTTADITYAYVGSSATVGIIFKNTKRFPNDASGSGFTDVHLYREGYPTDGSIIFTTPYLQALSKVSVIRMMDWTQTNTNSVTKWEQRLTPIGMRKAGPTYTGPAGYTFTGDQGFPIEHQIQLCNTLRVDCWINIPPAANDEYIKKVALALRYGTDGVNPYTTAQVNPVYKPLDTGLKVYVEYANEIWNSAPGFQSFRIVKDIVTSLPVTHPINIPEDTNIYSRMWKYPAYRLVTISDTFRSVFGDAAMMSIVRPVLMTQQGDGQMSLHAPLTWLDAYAKKLSLARDIKSYLYGAGGSGYYNLNTPLAAANQGNADLFFAAGNYPATSNFKGIGVDSVWAVNYGLKRIAYEGGPSLDYYSQDNAKKMNADPRMKDMIIKSHDEWSKHGGDLLVYYSLNGGAEWQFTPDINKNDTPKLLGLEQLISQPRVDVTLGQQIPGVVKATTDTPYRIRTGYDYAQTCEGVPCIGGNDKGEFIALPAKSSSAFMAKISVSGISYGTTTMDVMINGIKQGQVTMSPSNRLGTSTIIQAAIPKGLVVIRLEVTSGAFNLSSINVTQ